MGDSFFKSEKKRKRPNRGGHSGSASGSGSRGTGRGGPTRMPQVSASRRRAARDEELSSDDGDGGEALDDMDFQKDRGPIDLDDDEFVDAHETAAEKRIRLARGYLDKVARDVAAEAAEDDYDAAEIDKELIASRLRKDVDEHEGRIHRFFTTASASSTRFKSMPSPSTGVALTTGPIYLSSKNGAVWRFDPETLERTRLQAGDGGHRGQIHCLAASEDGTWVVTGGQDKVVGVWKEGKWEVGMRGHRDAVSSVTFPPLSNPSSHIFSASLGRHLVLHSLSTLSALDTFFGHQDAISSVSALKPQQAATAGSRDRTCRWWKVEDEVQLVLRAGGKTRDPESGREWVEGSADAVCVLDDSHFVSGGDTGSLALWTTGRKKPIFTQTLAHGLDTTDRNPLTSTLSSLPSPPSTPPTSPQPRGIASLAGLRGTNLFASGSYDGQIRLWALDTALKSFSPVGTVQVDGCVNALSLLEDGGQIRVAAAVGKEPRMGRWVTMDARNGLFVAHLEVKE